MPTPTGLRPQFVGDGLPVRRGSKRHPQEPSMSHLVPHPDRVPERLRDLLSGVRLTLSRHSG